MSEINVQLNDGAPVSIPESTTVVEALKKLDRDLAKQAVAARVDGREVDLTAELSHVRWTCIEELGQQTKGHTVKIEPVLPETLAGLDVLRHSTAHLLAAAVLDLFPGTK